MNEYTGNKTSKHTLVDVALITKQSTMKDTNVAEICKVLDINDKGIKVSSINFEEQLYCIALQNLDVQINDIVLVVYTNTDYRINLSRIKAGQSLQTLNNNTLHSKNFGVIIGLIYRKEEDNVTK